jgi:6-phosphogluconolactonase
MARAALIGRVPIPPANVHPVPADRSSPAEAARAYESALRAFFGPVPFPRFDLILLGVGEDGHTASLFPGTAALAERSRWAVDVPAPSHMSPHVPRVTLTFPVLNAARRVFFLAAGAKKAAILRAVLHGPPGRHPAQDVRPADGELVWWTDRAALADGPRIS